MFAHLDLFSEVKKKNVPYIANIRGSFPIISRLWFPGRAGHRVWNSEISRTLGMDGVGGTVFIVNLGEFYAPPELHWLMRFLQDVSSIKSMHLTLAL